MDRDELKNMMVDITPSHHKWLPKHHEYKELWAAIKRYTSFLDYKSPSIMERVYCIKNDITEEVLCKECQSVPVCFDYGRKKRYREYCSVQCFSKSNDVIQKRKNTCLEKYGVDNPSRTEEVKHKIKDTLMENYGVPSILCLKTTKEKATVVVREKYGTDHYLKSQKGQDLRMASCMEKYGVDHHMKSISVKEEMASRHIESHGVMYPLQRDDVIEKICNTHRKKYGKYFRQSHIPDEVVTLLNDREFLIKEHHDNQKPIFQIAQELGVNGSTVQRYCRNHGIEAKYFMSSQAEKEIADLIKGCGYNVLENDRTLIRPSELDITIPDKKLAIEYCGVYWHSEVNQPSDYHLDKLNKCKDIGYDLITIFEDEWIYRKEVVKRYLLNKIGYSGEDRVFARNCAVMSINKKESRDFLEENHLQGAGPDSIRYALTHNNQVVACMTFKSRVPGVFELSRYATSKKIVGGFSKLLKHFQRNNEWEEIITFADRRWSNGDLYDGIGFELVDTLKPDYRYVVGNRREHKFGFRHRSLAKKLENYDPNLTEHENCLNHKIYRIYDCGLLKYSMRS